MAKKASRAEYFRQYNPKRRAREAVRAKLAVDPVCQVCNWQFATVYWGPRSIYACEDCATKLSEWDGTWRPKAEAAAKATHDLWAGPKVVHIFEKGQGDVLYGEPDPASFADLPGIQALCGILSPSGPMMLDMMQPKELKKWPLCPACLQAYADPPGLTPLENNYFGYAIPTTAAPDPALETEAPADASADAPADAPVEPLIPAR